MFKSVHRSRKPKRCDDFPKTILWKSDTMASSEGDASRRSVKRRVPCDWDMTPAVPAVRQKTIQFTKHVNMYTNKLFLKTKCC